MIQLKVIQMFVKQMKEYEQKLSQSIKRLFIVQKHQGCSKCGPSAEVGSE